MKTDFLSLLLTTLIVSGCGGGSAATSAPPDNSLAPVPGSSGGVNAIDVRERPHIVLVSFDGFRWDYQDRFATPGMDRLAAAGVRAEALVPVFPTVTFPNHYSIATGLTPSNHGIVANEFPSRDRQRQYSLQNPAAVGDGTWYGGEPVWVAAESSGMVAAAYYFVGTEADIGGIRPTYWRTFDASVPGDVRVDQVLQWLNMPDETRPHFITLYFGSVDSVGHRFGPDSIEIEVAVGELDQLLSGLLDGIEQSPVSPDVYVVLVSDHGMSSHVPGSADLVLSELVDLAGISVVDGGSYAFLYFDLPDAARARQIRDTINALWQNGRAWLRDEAPGEWNVTPESRFPDIIVQADAGYRVVEHAGRLTELAVGLHGWAPGFTDMHGIFLASGARLPRGLTVNAVSVLDVYPLLMEILQIPLTAPIDGNVEALTGLLQE